MIARLIITTEYQGVHVLQFTKGFAYPFDRRDHFQRHRARFDPMDECEYERRADTFLGGPLKLSMKECVRVNGDVVRYDMITQEFGIIDRDMVIRTYFKPIPRRSAPPGVRGHSEESNLQYFKRECRK